MCFYFLIFVLISLIILVGTRLPGEEGLEEEERGSHTAAGSHQRTADPKKGYKDEE